MIMTGAVITIEKLEMIWARLPLEKAYNVRELGGLPTGDGGQTRWRAFLRADDISRLTDGDVEFLLDYGVRAVIDLRCKNETILAPDRLNPENGVDYVNISFMEEVDLSPKAIKNLEKIKMGDMYVEMLRREHAVKALFEAVADAKPGCVLFHCAAGKDRTGVFAMLLLMLAGVDKRDCVNNYTQTYQNLLRDERFIHNLAPDVPRPMMESRAEYIEAAYDYVEGQGGIVAFLTGCGLSENALDRVKERLTGRVLARMAVRG